MAVGALAIVAGIGLFLKLAYDQGWLGRIPPVAKIGVGLAFGAALIGLGELALRRWGRLASAGLSAAGVGAVYASIFAAYGSYALLGSGSAFVLLAAAAGLGVGIGVRARLRSVAILSVLGGYLVPFLLHEADGPPAVMPGYLFSLLLVGLGLSVRDRLFAPLRGVVWWGTLLLGGAWALASAGDHPLLVTGFAVAVWLAMHAELFLTARREPVSADAGEPGSPAASSPGPRLSWHDSIPLATSVSTTAWSVLLAWAAFEEGRALPAWLAPAGWGVAALVAAQVLAGHLRILVDAPRNGPERLGAVLLAQTGALLIVAAALALIGPAQAASWLAMGLGAVVAGRWIRSRGLDVYGLVVLALGTAQVLFVEAWRWHAGGRTIAGLHLTWWTLLAGCAGGCWIAAALLLRDGRGWRRAAAGCGSVGGAVLLAALWSDAGEPASIGVAWGVLGAVFCLTHARTPRLGLDLPGVLGFLAAAAAWGWAFVPDWMDSAAPGALHPGLGAAAAIVAAMAASAALAPRIGGGRVWTVRFTGPVLATLATLLALTATSLEVARVAGMSTSDPTARAAAVSVWWALFAAGLLAVGAVRRRALVRYAGLGLLGIAAAKAVVFDLAAVGPVWRTVSVLGVGVLMLGVAVMYARTRRGRGEPEPAASPGASAEG